MYYRKLIFSAPLIVLVLVSSWNLDADELLIDRPPDPEIIAVRDQDYPVFPDFSLFIVANVIFDSDVEISSITTNFTNQNGSWPEIGLGLARLNVFEGELGSDDDPSQGMLVEANFVESAIGIDLVADLTQPLVLKGGTQYWIGLTPFVSFGEFGSENHWGSVLGSSSMARNPGGGFGVPGGTEWFDAAELTGEPTFSAAITICGQALATVVADSFTAFRGFLNSGELADTFESDDSHLKYNPGVTLNSIESPVWLIFDGTLPADNPNSLRVKLEASSNTVNLTQTINMFNWNTGQFETVDSTEAAGFNTDAIHSIDVSANIGDYVQSGTGAVRSRFGWKAASLVFVYPWTINVDQVVWNVTE